MGEVIFFPLWGKNFHATLKIDIFPRSEFTIVSGSPHIINDGAFSTEHQINLLGFRHHV